MKSTRACKLSCCSLKTHHSLDFAKYFIHFADLTLIFEEYGCIKVWDLHTFAYHCGLPANGPGMDVAHLFVGELADCFSFAFVLKFSGFDHSFWRSLVPVPASSAKAAPAAATRAPSSSATTERHAKR